MSGARPEVIVIGGGPAGLSAAIAARLKGFEVTVAEGAYPPIDKACGEGILPECVEALRRLDVDPRGEGYRFRGVRFVDRGVVVEAAFHAAFGLALRRSRLHELLVRRAGELGVRLLWGKRVHDLDRLIASAWVIAADGLNSAIRLAAGLDHGRTRQPRCAFRRRYHLSPWTNLVEVHLGARCQIYVTPVGHDEIGLALVTRDSHQRLDTALPEFPALQARLRGAETMDAERGALTASHRFPHISRPHCANRRRLRLRRRHYR